MTPSCTRDEVAVLDPLEQLGGGVVDERHPGVDDDLRAQVGIAAADAGGDVDHGRHTARDKRLRAHPVDVDMIDNRDFPGLEALGQPLGPPIDSRHCRHPGKVRDLPAAEARELALKPVIGTFITTILPEGMTGRATHSAACQICHRVPGDLLPQSV